MCNEFVTHKQQQCMSLSMGDSHTSAQVDMMCTDESDEEQMQTYPVVNRMDVTEEQPLLPLTTFMDVDTAVTSAEETQTAKHSLTSYQPLDTDPTTIKVTTRRGSYRRYTEDQVEKLFVIVIEEGKAEKRQVLITSINIRTAKITERDIMTMKKDVLPIDRRKPNVLYTFKLTETHSQFRRLH